jgi:hypothetical protein
MTAIGGAIYQRRLRKPSKGAESLVFLETNNMCGIISKNDPVPVVRAIQLLLSLITEMEKKSVAPFPKWLFGVLP